MRRSYVSNKNYNVRAIPDKLHFADFIPSAARNCTFAKILKILLRDHTDLALTASLMKLVDVRFPFRPTTRSAICLAGRKIIDLLARTQTCSKHDNNTAISNFIHSLNIYFESTHQYVTIIGLGRLKLRRRIVIVRISAVGT